MNFVTLLNTVVDACKTALEILVRREGPLSCSINKYLHHLTIIFCLYNHSLTFLFDNSQINRLSLLANCGGECEAQMYQYMTKSYTVCLIVLDDVQVSVFDVYNFYLCKHLILKCLNMLFFTVF